MLAAVSVVLSALAALFAYLSWRWYSIDDELARREKIDNRLSRLYTNIKYEPEPDPPTPDTSSSAVHQLLEQQQRSPIPEFLETDRYTAKVGNVIVSELNGVRYGLRKAIRGEFEGETLIEIDFTETTMRASVSELPSDIQRVRRFDLEEYSIDPDSVSMHQDDGILGVTITSADPDTVAESVNNFLADIGEQFGTE